VEGKTWGRDRARCSLKRMFVVGPNLVACISGGMRRAGGSLRPALAQLSAVDCRTTVNRTYCTLYAEIVVHDIVD